jgi:hypothetical protein
LAQRNRLEANGFRIAIVKDVIGGIHSCGKDKEQRNVIYTSG